MPIAIIFTLQVALVFTVPADVFEETEFIARPFAVVVVVATFSTLAKLALSAFTPVAASAVAVTKGGDVKPALLKSTVQNPLVAETTPTHIFGALLTKPVESYSLGVFNPKSAEPVESVKRRSTPAPLRTR